MSWTKVYVHIDVHMWKINTITCIILIWTTQCFSFKFVETRFKQVLISFFFFFENPNYEWAPIQIFYNYIQFILSLKDPNIMMPFTLAPTFIIYTCVYTLERNQILK
jgi:hypothetical protein